MSEDQPSSTPDDGSGGQTTQQKPGADEVYCMECGAIIKKQAEICTECGVRQREEETPPAPAEPQPNQGGALPDHREYDLKRLAEKDTTAVLLVAFLVSPVGYWMVGKKGLAIVNVLTFNFLLLGPLIVPIHCHRIIENAKDELRRNGVEGY